MRRSLIAASYQFSGGYFTSQLKTIFLSCGFLQKMYSGHVCVLSYKFGSGFWLWTNGKIVIRKNTVLSWLCIETTNFIFSHQLSRQDHELMWMFNLLAISLPKITPKITQRQVTAYHLQHCHGSFIWARVCSMGSQYLWTAQPPTLSVIGVRK